MAIIQYLGLYRVKIIELSDCIENNLITCHRVSRLVNDDTIIISPLTNALCICVRMRVRIAYVQTITGTTRLTNYVMSGDMFVQTVVTRATNFRNAGKVCSPSVVVREH